jgi:hypothetical protein
MSDLIVSDHRAHPFAVENRAATPTLQCLDTIDGHDDQALPVTDNDRFGTVLTERRPTPRATDPHRASKRMSRLVTTRRLSAERLCHSRV